VPFSLNALIYTHYAQQDRFIRAQTEPSAVRSNHLGAALDYAREGESEHAVATLAGADMSTWGQKARNLLVSVGRFQADIVERSTCQSIGAARRKN
jgi:hypothetical protein